MIVQRESILGILRRKYGIVSAPSGGDQKVPSSVGAPSRTSSSLSTPATYPASDEVPAGITAMTGDVALRLVERDAQQRVGDAVANNLYIKTGDEAGKG